MFAELVHVMLKPDTLECDIRDSVVAELQGLGGVLLVSKRMVLDLFQISEIYPVFPNERAKPAVFHYFTTRETEHLVFAGDAGIHARYHREKGKPGKGGIRGKYYTRYTKLTPEELSNWFAGTLHNLEEIDLEMFGRDILHVPNTIEQSLRGLRAVLGRDQFQLLKDQVQCVS